MGGLSTERAYGTLRSAAGRVRELCPLTGLGALVAGVAYAGLSYYGYGQLDLVWYVASLAGLGLAGASVLTVLLSAIFVRRSIRRQPSSSTSSPGATGIVTAIPWTGPYRLPRLRWWPLLSTELRWLQPASVSVELVPERGRWRERVSLVDHGEVRLIRRCITIKDVLGLASLSLRHTTAPLLDVLPHRGALGEVPWLSSLAGGDDTPHPLGVAGGDRLDLRRYAAGDPARFIHWKVYARSRKLVVRVPERALSPAHRTAAYLIAGPHDGASAASALAALGAGAFGSDWVFGADGTPGVATSTQAVEAAVRRSAAHRGEGGAGLAAFVREASEQGPVALMLFVPAGEGHWQTAALGQLSRSVITPRVLIGVDGIAARPAVALWRRAALHLAPAAGYDASRVAGLASRLRSSGAEVWIADRVSGRLLGERHLRAAAGRRAA